MFSLLETTIQSATLNPSVLEAAYELYLQADGNDSPIINLKELSKRTRTSMLECRNMIVTANRMGKFPNCSLSY
ncbi:MAG: hypothetical protein ACM37W_16430 [Actinomycetota bacterium]